MSIVSRVTESVRHWALHQTLGGQRASLMEALAPIDLASLVLAVDELGWQKLGGPQADNANDFLPMDRVQMVRRSRLYWHRDPLVKQAVHLYTAYALGQGLTIQHPDEGAQAILDAFHRDPRNSKVWGPQGKRFTSNKLLVDGEVFPVIMGADPDHVQARLIDPLEITAFISNPEDALDVWYYRREYSVGNTRRVVYYADANAPAAQDGSCLTALPPEQAQEIDALRMRDAVALHHAINTIGQRGYPLATPALDWSKSARTFMEDRATLTHTAAQILLKKTVKGGPSRVQDVATSLTNAAAFPGGPAMPGNDRRGPIAGATWVGNQGIDLEQFRFDTQAGNAEKDRRSFVLHALMGFGIPEHYAGDSSSGNLATATAMERPVELIFTEYQESLISLYLAVCRAILVLAGSEADLDALEAVTPPILNVDKPVMLKSLTDLCNTVPTFNVPVIWREMLTLIGVPDVDAALVELEKAHAEGAPTTRAAGLPVAGAPVGADGAPPPAPGSPPPPPPTGATTSPNPTAAALVHLPLLPLGRTNGKGGSH